MRKKLGLFANIRPVETFELPEFTKSPLKDELVRGAELHLYPRTDRRHVFRREVPR